MVRKIFKQLSLINVILLVLPLVSLKFFFNELPDVFAADFAPALFLVILFLEFFLVSWVDPQGKKAFLNPLLLTHLPWLLGFFTSTALSLDLPEPHNFLERKAEILMGLMWTAHLFLLTGWLLARARKDEKNVPKRFGLVAILFFVGITFWTTQCDLSGDEPHYLLMAQSLIQDGDLDLTNNYNDEDYQRFYQRGELVPQGLDHITVSKIYSYHPLGPVLTVLPGFWFLGRLGASLTMALLAALALFLTLRVMELAGAKGWPLQAVGAIGLFSSPLLLFAGVIYPEIPTACLVAGAFWLFLRKSWGWFGVCQGVMLWMHNRNAILMIPFLLFAAYAIWKSKKSRMAEAGKLAVGLAVPVLSLAFYFQSIYGVFTPLGAHNEPFSSLFRLGHFWDGFFGLLLDQECGLWFHFPIFAMAVTGGAILWKSRNPLGFLGVGVFSFYYLFMSFYENLGLTPATRYMVGVTPFLLFALYPVLERMKKWDAWAFLTVIPFGLGLLVNWVLAAIPWMRYNKLQGENWMLKIAGDFLGLPLPSWEVSFQTPVILAQSYAFSAFWVVVTVALSVWFIREKVKK
jgi:hypothetical protein